MSFKYHNCIINWSTCTSYSTDLAFTTSAYGENDVSINEVTPTTIEIRWEPMEGIDEYLLHLSSGGSVTSDTISVADIDEYNSYTFRDLEPGTLYEIEVIRLVEREQQGEKISLEQYTSKGAFKIDT